VDPIPHIVGTQGLKNGGLDLLSTGYLGIGQGAGRVKKSIQVGVELKDTPIVDSQPFIYGVSVLDGAVKDGDLGLFSRYQLSSHVNPNISISGIR
jgi:hypothetical protein